MSGDVIYRENDKILQLENDPDNNVFNGDIGYIMDITGSTITVDFDGNIVKYKMDNENNTEATIAENYLIGQVSVRPTEVAEFIDINFVLTSEV